MSSPIAKSVKKLTSRIASRHSSTSSSARKRVVAGKSTRLKPATKRSLAGKARARKATKARATKQKARSVTPRASLTKRRSTKAHAKSKRSAPVRRSASTARPKKAPVRSSLLKAAHRRIILPPKKPALPPPQPTYDEAAALSAFEAARREFTRGRFAESRDQFRALVEKYTTVSEVTARARTYLAIAEARLRAEFAQPRDADSLYDRGVIELNRGEYVAAQELFERALKREPDAAHIHYGLAATRARLGAIDTALKSLRRALDLQPNLRIRAQRDHDLNPLRSDPEFETLVFARD